MLIIFVFAAVLAFFYYIFFTPNYYTRKSPIRFEIKRGETLSSIADSLAAQGIIPHASNFSIAAFIYGAERSIRAGRYFIPNGLSYLSLVEFFIHTRANYAHIVTIPQGSTIKFIAARVKYDLFVDSASFVNKAEDKNFIDSLGLHTSTLEGYLFPGKYDLYERSTPSEIIGIFYKTFKKFITDSLRKRADSLGYSVYEILTLASIVDGETNKIDEMPEIASVYYNRLKKGMPLEADPTIQYLQTNGWKRLLKKDLKIKSPYNTYIHQGLPPGPINNPGKEAILAVLYPAKTDYMYFVADGTGGHKFSRSYSQHLLNVNQYRKWLKEHQQ